MWNDGDISSTHQNCINSLIAGALFDAAALMPLQARLLSRHSHICVFTHCHSYICTRVHMRMLLSRRELCPSLRALRSNHFIRSTGTFSYFRLPPSLRICTCIQPTDGAARRGGRRQYWYRPQVDCNNTYWNSTDQARKITISWLVVKPSYMYNIRTSGSPFKKKVYREYDTNIHTYPHKWGQYFGGFLAPRYQSQFGCI